MLRDSRVEQRSSLHDTTTCVICDGNIAMACGKLVDGVDVSVLGANAVAGHGSASDNAVTRFDSTTGKVVQDSAVTIAEPSPDFPHQMSIPRLAPGRRSLYIPRLSSARRA
jgi:hypothetical protein